VLRTDAVDDPLWHEHSVFHQLFAEAGQCANESSVEKGRILFHLHGVLSVSAVQGEAAENLRILVHSQLLLALHCLQLRVLRKQRQLPFQVRVQRLQLHQQHPSLDQRLHLSQLLLPQLLLHRHWQEYTVRALQLLRCLLRKPEKLCVVLKVLYVQEEPLHYLRLQKLVLVQQIVQLVHLFILHQRRLVVLPCVSVLKVQGLHL